MLKFIMSRLFLTFVLSFFVMFSPVKSFAGSWIELDSNWFGSDWYYHSDTRIWPSGAVSIWLSENFDEIQTTKDKRGQIHRYNQIVTHYFIHCNKKVARSDEVQLWLNNEQISPKGIDLDDLPNIDYGGYYREYSKISGSLKSPLKKICKIYG